MSSFRKILILQTAFAGDVVLAAPLAEGAKRAFSDAEIHFLVIADTAILLKHNPFVDRVWIYDKRGSEKGLRSFFHWVGRLQAEGFDLVLLPHRSMRSALMVLGARIPRRVGFRRGMGALLYTNVIPYPRDVHEVERNFHLLRVLGWEGETTQPKLYPGSEEKREVDRFLEKAGVGLNEKIIAMAPGSVWPTKRWLPEGFAEVAKDLWQRLGIRSIIVGGDKDDTIGDAIVRESGECVINATGQFSLLASAEMIRRCRVILTNDSAPLHMAVAVGISVVALFGPTVPAFGFGPYGEKHTILQKELDCRPCSIHGGRKCPEGHFWCMKNISSEEVIRAIEGYLH